MDRPLKIKVQLSVVEDLGIKLYGTLPPVISEIVANAWDADASRVEINFPDGTIGEDLAITVADDGCSMTYGEIQDKYLSVGRKRRDEEQSETTPKGRKLMGRKGIGKLSVFGVAKTVEIKTVKGGILNVFQMNVDDLLKSAKEYGEYEPVVTRRGEKTELNSGTTVTMKCLKRKTQIKADSIRKSIAKHFSVIGEKFKVSVNGKDVTSADKLNKSDMEYSWDFDGSVIAERPDLTVTGWIGAARDPLDESKRGITVLASGKLIQDNTFFDVKIGEKFSYSYIAGEIVAEFFDGKEDLISTNRLSLIWETDEGEALRAWGNKELRRISEELSKKRREKREEEIREDEGLRDWLDSLKKPEKRVADKVVKAITSSDRLSVDRRRELMGYVVESFDQSVFRDMIDNLDRYPDPAALIEMFEEWDVIEAREITRIVKGRLETIERLGRHIDANAKEVPTIHQYFKKWPWILEPTWTHWQDEVRYSKLLKENFPDEDLGEPDRRIDFLAVGVGDTIHVVELKRPKYKIKLKDLDQLIDYVEFIRERLGNDPTRSRNSVAGYIIAGGAHDDRVMRHRLKSAMSDRIYIRTYEDLIATARELHQEFQEKLNEFNRPDGMIS